MTSSVSVRAADFSRFVHQIFSYRRKTLRKAMAEAGHDASVLERIGIDPQLRPENLRPEQFQQLFEQATPSV